MQDKGINSTFKKIIYESSEMVFLADDTYPYSIFYGNESFEETIGESLSDRSLVGLGLDINAYIFKEELVLTHSKKEYSFKLELPQDNGSNYFLFYKGKEIKSIGLPSKKEAYQFFSSSLELMAIGQSDQLSYVNPIVQSLLGYHPEELIRTNICPIILEEDLPLVQTVWRSHKTEQKTLQHRLRVKTKSNEVKSLDISVQFQGESFFMIARDVTSLIAGKEDELFLLELKRKLSPEDRSGWFKLHLDEDVMESEYAPSWFFASDEKSPNVDQFKAWFVSRMKQNLPLLSDQPFAKFQWNHAEWPSIIVQAFNPSVKNQVWGTLSIKSEDKVLKSELELQRVLWLNLPEAVIVVSENGAVFSCNKEAIRLFELDELDQLRHLDELIDSFGATLYWREWILKATETTQVFEALSKTASGQQLHLEVLSRKIEVGVGKSLISLSFKNNSEKVKLEKTIEESSQFLFNLTEQVPGGLYQLVLNSEGQMKFSFLSKDIQSVLGITQEKVTDLSDLSEAIAKVHPLDLPNVVMTSVASARKMEPWQCQFRVKSDLKTSEYRWVLGAARPQSLDNGDMVWYGYLTDITNQKEFENSLNEAKMAAEKASQIKSDFLSMISHELRTPLNAISGSVYSLIQENPTEGQKSALNTINFAVDNLIIMINDLLDFQKIEAGKLTIEHVPFHLGDLIRQVIMGLSFHAKDSKNKLELHTSPEVDVTVKGDKTRISQVLNNLITNALKFTKEGTVDVKVELMSREVDRIRVYFEVKDSGIGIAPEHQELIFNDFDQVKPTFSTKYGGTGLGLSITRKLLGLMGGKIALESEVGKGSRFFFELEFDLAQGSISSQFNSGNKIENHKGLHLLMAEDNDVNALVLGKIVKKWGYTFDRALNGLEAVSAAKSARYDCILMDIQMPEMDGFEATRAIKEFSNVPVIALTAAAKQEIMEQIDACGFEGFVAKPIDAAELYKKINEVISAQSFKA